MADASAGRISAGLANGLVRSVAGGGWPLRIVAVLALFGFIGVPLVRLVGVAMGQGIGAAIGALGQPRVAGAIVDSAWTGAAAAVLAVAAGTAAALATERARLGGRWLRGSILLPLLCPPFIAAFGWGRAYGPRGLTDQLVGIQLPGLYGPLGIVLVLAVAAAPLVWLIVAGALATRVEPDLERAARAAGATTWTTLRTITLPLLAPAIGSAFVVAFAFSVNAFGVPAVLGTPAGFATITTRLYQDLALSADPSAFVEAALLGATLVLVALVVVGPADAWLTGRTAVRTGTGGGAPVTIAGGRKARIVLTVAVVVLVLLLVVGPLLAVVLAALTRADGLAPIPANWTLANFGTALDQHFGDGLVHSLILAAAAATAVLPLGALVAALGRRRSLVRTLATLGFALPGSALAIAVLLAYGDWLRDSLAIIFVAYVAKFWALGQRQVAGSIDRLPPDAVRAARASGAGLPVALRSVVVPLLRPSLLAGWLIVFLFALHELTMSSLLYGPGTATLSVVVLNAQQLGDPTVTAALAVLLILVIGVVAAPLALVARRPR